LMHINGSYNRSEKLIYKSLKWEVLVSIPIGHKFQTYHHYRYSLKQAVWEMQNIDITLMNLPNVKQCYRVFIKQ